VQTQTTQSPGTESQDSSADQAKDKAREVAGQAQEKVQEATGQAKDRVREQVDQRSTQAGEQVASTATDVRSVGEELRKQGKDGPARIADQVADRGERLGSYLRDSDSDRILHDLEDFGRSRPWALVAGGLALGFVASRFLKASSGDRYRARQPALADRSPNGSEGLGGAHGTRPTGLPAHR
jgi:hypothetical protein